MNKNSISKCNIASSKKFFLVAILLATIAVIVVLPIGANAFTLSPLAIIRAMWGTPMAVTLSAPKHLEQHSINAHAATLRNKNNANIENETASMPWERISDDAPVVSINNRGIRLERLERGTIVIAGLGDRLIPAQNTNNLPQTNRSPTVVAQNDERTRDVLNRENNNTTAPKPTTSVEPSDYLDMDLKDLMQVSLR